MAIEIRSYRSVFELERRIYRVDRVRLNPSGVPVRGALYFVALLLMALLAAALPLVGMPLRLLPWIWMSRVSTLRDWRATTLA